jgi:hypothetical protein
MAVAIGLASIVALGGFGGHGAVGGVVVPPPTSSSPIPIASAESTATARPSAAATPRATAAPTPRPTRPAAFSTARASPGRTWIRIHYRLAVAPTRIPRYALPTRRSRPSFSHSVSLVTAAAPR